jgi:hypothetical protein
MKSFLFTLLLGWLCFLPGRAFVPSSIRRPVSLSTVFSNHLIQKQHKSQPPTLSAIHVERRISSIELRQQNKQSKLPFLYLVGSTGLLSVLSKWTDLVSTWQERSQWLSFFALLGSLSRVPLGALLQTYTLWLTTQPLLTKSITSAVMGCVGDAVAQRWEHHPVYSKRRGVAAMVEGLLWSGPLMHLAYSLFEHILPIGNNMGFALIHVLLDSLLLDSVFVTSAFWITGLLEGFSFKQLRQQYQRDIGGTLKASWLTSLFLLPVEVVCFRYLPVTYRVLAVNVLDIVWDTVISFMSHKTRGKELASTITDESLLQSPILSPSDAVLATN